MSIDKPNSMPTNINIIVIDDSYEDPIIFLQNVVKERLHGYVDSIEDSSFTGKSQQRQQSKLKKFFKTNSLNSTKGTHFNPRDFMRMLLERLHNSES